MNDLAIKSRWETPIPVPKQMQREEQIDQLTRDAMFSSWDFAEALTHDEANEIVVEAIHACWRGNYRDDTERLYALKAAIEGFIDAWAEMEADHED